LSKGGHQTTIGAVVVRQDDTTLVELRDRVEVVRDEVHVTDIRALISDLVKGLGKSRATKRLLAFRKVNKHEHRLPNLLDPAELRRPRPPDVLNNFHGGDDDGHRRSHALGLASLAGLPASLH